MNSIERKLAEVLVAPPTAVMVPPSGGTVVPAQPKAKPKAVTPPVVSGDAGDYCSPRPIPAKTPTPSGSSNGRAAIIMVPSARCARSSRPILRIAG